MYVLTRISINEIILYISLDICYIFVLGYVSSLVSGNSSKLTGDTMTDLKKVLTPPRVFEPPQCFAQDVSRYQTNNNNR